MEELDNRFAGLSVADGNPTNSERAYEANMPSLNRNSELKKQSPPAIQEDTILSRSEIVFDALMARFKYSLKFVSPDTLVTWNEMAFKAALSSLASSRYFESEVNELLGSRDSDKKWGDSSMATTFRVIPVEEDPIWVSHMPNEPWQGYDPNNDYVRDFSKLGKYKYNDLTLYVSSQTTKGTTEELIVLQMELKYVNMSYLFKKDRNQPFNQLYWETNRHAGGAGSFKKQRVTPFAFMNYMEDMEKKNKPGSITFQTQQIQPEKDERLSTANETPERPVFIQTTVEEYLEMVKPQSTRQLEGKTSMMREHVMPKNPKLDSVLVTNYTVLGYVDRIVTDRCGFNVLSNERL